MNVLYRTSRSNDLNVDFFASVRVPHTHKLPKVVDHRKMAIGDRHTFGIGKIAYVSSLRIVYEMFTIPVI